MASQQGSYLRLIEDNGFQHYVRLRQRAVEFYELMLNIGGSVANTDPIDPQSYVRTLAEVIPQLRNDLAMAVTILSTVHFSLLAFAVI